MSASQPQLIEPQLFEVLKTKFPNLTWEYRIQSDNLAKQYRLYQGEAPPLYLQVAEEFDRYSASIWLNKTRLFKTKGKQLTPVLSRLKKQADTFRFFSDALRQADEA